MQSAPADSVLDGARALADKLAQKPPQALQETKRSINLHLQAAALRVLPFALSAVRRLDLRSGVPA